MIKLFEHQKRHASFHLRKRKSCDFSEQGTGKTFTAITTMLHADDCDFAIIVTPKHLLYNWKNDLLKFNIPESEIFIADYDNLRKIDNFKTILGKYAVILINYDQFRINISSIVTFLTKNSVFIIADEAHAIGNPKTKITKAFLRASKYVKRLLLMTGTPISNSPEKVYPLMRMVAPGLYRNKKEFVYRYAIMKEIRTKGGRTIFIPDSWVGLPKLYKDIAPYSVRVEKDQVFDLPERIFVDRFIPLEKEQEKMYQKILIEMFYINEQGEMFLTVHKLAEFIRLRQVSSNPYLLEPNYPSDILEREKSLLEDIKNYDGKKVIFCEFVGTFNRLQELFKKNGIKYVAVRGGDKHISEKQEQFTKDESIEVFLGVRAACYTGLNLQVASTLINYELSFDLLMYQQSIDRIHRWGQKNKVVVINYYSSDIEQLILNVLKNKISNEREVLDLFRKKIEKSIDKAVLL